MNNWHTSLHLIVGMPQRAFYATDDEELLYYLSKAAAILTNGWGYQFDYDQGMGVYALVYALILRNELAKDDQYQPTEYMLGVMRQWGMKYYPDLMQEFRSHL